MKRAAIAIALAAAFGLFTLASGCSKPSTEAQEGKVSIKDTKGRTGPVARQNKYGANQGAGADQGR